MIYDGTSIQHGQQFKCGSDYLFLLHIRRQHGQDFWDDGQNREQAGFLIAAEKRGNDLPLPAGATEIPVCVQIADSGIGQCLAAGEQLRATGIVTDKLGQRFYRIEEGGVEHYIAAGAVCAQEASTDDLELEMPVMARGYREDAQEIVSGTVIAKSGSIDTVEVLVTNGEGIPVMRERAEVFGCCWDMGSLNERLSADLLTPGTYTVAVYVDSVLPVIEGGQIQNRYTRVLLQELQLQVRMERAGISVSTTIINEQTA